MLIPVKTLAGMFFCVPLFLACENDLEEVQIVTATDETPDEVVNNMHTIYSDSGVVKYEIIANRMEVFDEKKTTIFKDGFQVNFFKSKDSIEAHLEAEYGEMREGDQLVLARNKVVFTNYSENQTLKTEELFWLQSAKKVQTEKRFEIFGENYYARGVGLESNETFSDYEMHNVTMEKKLEE